MASGVTITRTISNSTRDGNTPKSRRPRPNSTRIYGYPNSSSTPASNARCAVLHDAPEVPGRSTNRRAPRPASVAEHYRRRPGDPASGTEVGDRGQERGDATDDVVASAVGTPSGLVPNIAGPRIYQMAKPTRWPYR